MTLQRENPQNYVQFKFFAGKMKMSECEKWEEFDAVNNFIK